MIFSGFLALTVVGIVVGFLSWKWLKEKVYLLFSIYLASIVLISLFGGFLVGQEPLPEEYLGVFRLSIFLAVLSNYSCFLFIRTLIAPQELTPRLYKLLVVVLAGLTMVDVYVFFTADVFAWNLRGQLLMIFTILNLGVQIRASMTMRFVRWYVAGIILFLVSAIPFVLLNSGVISSFTPVTASIPYLGILLQTVLFLIGLLDRLRHEYNRNLNEARIKLLGTAAAEIFHELISPLTIIMANGIKLREVTSKISDHAVGQELDTINERIEHNLQRVGANIDRFRLLSGHGSQEVSQEKILARDVVTGAVELARYRIEKKGCTVEVDDSCSHLVYLRGSVFDLEQILANLLINAADAVQDLNERWVKIQTGISEGVLLINIIDSGKGIPPALRRQIFEEFFTTKKHGEGSGLGLSFSRKIIEKYGGTISIDEKSPNTCFTVRLPISN